MFKAQLMSLLLLAVVPMSAFASKGMTLCDKDPAAPMCVQSRPKIPASLPERYTITSVTNAALTAFTAATHDTAGALSCKWVNTHAVALTCLFASQAGRTCQLDLLQVDASNKDYSLRCNDGLHLSALVNPGRVPDTMD